MQDFVPKEIADLIDLIEAKQGEDFRKQKRAEDAEYERLRKIEALREARGPELREACRTIQDWIERFDETAGPAVWRLNEGVGIVIFSAKFFRGEPTPPGDRACSAQLRLGPLNKKPTERFVYEELHKGQVSLKHPLLSPLYLASRAHPDFVAQCAAHLSGPDAWSLIRTELERLKRMPPR